MRNFKELSRLTTFEERVAYLSLTGSVGVDTFGFDRWVNQYFYRSRAWRRVRAEVILRDSGCDLGVPGREIYSNLLVHHMEPVTKQDIVDGSDWILDPEYLVTTQHDTHNLIHYGSSDALPKPYEERKPGDTKLW